MLVFHGTRMDDPWAGFPNGLQPLGGLTAIERAKQVLAVEGETLESVPKRVWWNEIEHRRYEYEKDGPWVQCTTSFSQARAYSSMGGEFVYCIRRNLWIWRNRRRQRLKDFYQRAHEFGIAKNGKHRVVVAIRVPEQVVCSMVPRPDGLRELIKEGYTWEYLHIQVRLPEVMPGQIEGLAIVGRGDG